MLLSAACGGSNGETAEQITEPEKVLSVPGVISLPGENGFTDMVEHEQQAVLLYCWVPIGEYQESESDLGFLAALAERGITPVPVQFSTQVRNAAQNQLNGLGIALPVALGSDSVRIFMNISCMPAAVLVQKNGEIHRGNGFGCAERVVRSAM